MKLSARNQLPGTVVEVSQGAVNGIVKIEVAPGLVISSSITNAAIKELGLTVGSKAVAVIMASTDTGGVVDFFTLVNGGPRRFSGGATLLSVRARYCPRLTDSSSMTATSRTSGSFPPDEAVAASLFAAPWSASEETKPADVPEAEPSI